jgi:hypothetical protein
VREQYLAAYNTIPGVTSLTSCLERLASPENLHWLGILTVERTVEVEYQETDGTQEATQFLKYAHGANKCFYRFEVSEGH